MTKHATALVQTGPQQLEYRQVELPADLPPGAAIVKVEANGLCHSDVDAYDGTDPLFEGNPAGRYPRIMGHEIVGRIERLGPATENRSSLAVGDLVAINPFIGCGACPYCVDDNRPQCTGWDTASNLYGFIPTTFGPGLWGGYATHVYVHPNTILYRFGDHIDPLDASLWNLLAGGIQWAVMNPKMQPGARVAILGCGQRGLACVIAVRAHGAGHVLTSGLSRDADKLRLSREFGADTTVDVETQDLRQIAEAVTDGAGFDLVIDTSPHSFDPVADAIAILRPGGTLVTVGLKTRAMPDFPLDTVTLKGLRIIGSLGQSHDAYSRAAELVSEQRFPLHRMRTHVLGLDGLEEAISLLRGDRPDQRPINVVLRPGLLTQA